MNLIEFLQSPYDRSWLEIDDDVRGHLSVYVRKAHHAIPSLDIVLPTFDIASVAAAKQRHGAFRAFLDIVESTLIEYPQYKALFVENVLNEYLAAFLEKRGYQVSGATPVCYYRRIPRTYRIVRFFQNERPREIINTGFTLEQAQRHCNDPKTKRKGSHILNGWFDGYEEET